jgi:hypothetical protein
MEDALHSSPAHTPSSSSSRLPPRSPIPPQGDTLPRSSATPPRGVTPPQGTTATPPRSAAAPFEHMMARVETAYRLETPVCFALFLPVKSIALPQHCTMGPWHATFEP